MIKLLIAEVKSFKGEIFLLYYLRKFQGIICLLVYLIFQVCRGNAEAAGQRGRGCEAGVRGGELPPGARHH